MKSNVLVAALTLAFGALACEGAHEPGPGGDLTDSLTFDGALRIYDAHISRRYERGMDIPLIIALHASPGTGATMRDVSDFDPAADSLGFIVVYPDATSDWAEGCGCSTADLDGVDDVGFMRALIDRLDDRWGIDRSRVFAVGFSQGGLFAHRVGCDAAAEFAGIGVVATTMSRPVSQACDPSEPVAMILMAGTHDQLFPYAGSAVDLGEFTTISAVAAIDLWRGHNGCVGRSVGRLEPDLVDDGWRVRVDEWDPCQSGSRVALYTILGAGHVWPKGDIDPAFAVAESFLEATAQ